jgi:hypothetical protein
VGLLFLSIRLLSVLCFAALAFLFCLSACLMQSTQVY